MNTFAKIKLIAEYEKVTYYSVNMDDNESTLFEDFVSRHTETDLKKLNHILVWIKSIGKNYGAQKHFFRPEADTADASALPPQGVDRKPNYIEHGKKKSNNLRLYCLRANESVVFLFNGDIKTEIKAQNCPNVRPHFKLANKLTKALDEAFFNKDIVWNEYFDNIIFDKDLRIEL